MKKIELIQSIKQQDLIWQMLSAKWWIIFKTNGQHHIPARKQTEAVNDYLRSVHANGDGTVERNRHSTPEIATQKITINAIRVLDHEQLDRLQDVSNHIAADKEYYMPEKKYSMCR